MAELWGYMYLLTSYRCVLQLVSKNSKPTVSGFFVHCISYCLVVSGLMQIQFFEFLPVGNWGWGRGAQQ
ncbi:unnamed protein product [Musa acuminata subsp. burmannicoides]